MDTIADIVIERPSAFYACIPLLLGVMFYAVRYKKLSLSLNSRMRKVIKLPLVCRTLFFSTSLLMFICAYSGMSWGGTVVPVQKNGRAVSFIFDISYSMTARDAGGGRSRLESAAQYAESLLDSMENAGWNVSISVVLAKGEGTVAIPLTEDRAVVRGLLASLSPDMMTASGSSLGKGITAAIGSFPVHSSMASHIWLFTDGEETDSALALSLNDAVKYGIPVSIIGFGSENESEVLTGDGKTFVKTALRSDAIRSIINAVQSKNSKIRQNSLAYVKAQDKGSAYTLLRNTSGETSVSYETQNIKRSSLFLKLGIIFLILSYIAGEFRLESHKKLMRVFGAFVVMTMLSGCSGHFSSGTKILEGRMKWNRKDYQQATACFLEALEMSSRNNDAYLEQYALYGLASTYMMLEENDAAVQRLRQIAPDAPDDIMFAVLYDTGVMAHKKGDYESAASFFRQALMINSSDISAKINLELSLDKISVHNSVKERSLSSISEDSEEQALENAIYSMMREKEQDTWKSQKQENMESGSLDY